MNRTCQIQPLGDIDEGAGEFWVSNPFQMPAAGHNLSAYERNRMFLNVESRRFMDASVFSGCDIDADSRSVIPADFDRDGRVDLLVGSVGGGPLRLFLNRLSNHANFARIVLEGASSNRSAIGAKVRLSSGGRVIHRSLFFSNGFAGQSPAELTIGLGAGKQIDQLTVDWPSGKAVTLGPFPETSIVKVSESLGEP